MAIIILIFWFLFFLLIYTYVGYPLLLRTMAKFVQKKVNKGKIFPFVSILIPVYNEEKYIQSKIENILAVNYPKNKLEILVVSDCSDDNSNSIVERFTRQIPNLKFLLLAKRSGKTIAQNEGIKHCQGEIIIFSDASCLIDPDGIMKLIQNFNDATVGCVSSEDVNIYDTEVDYCSGESKYVGFDLKLRRFESKVSSLVGNSGCFYAVRREFCLEFPDHIIRDFATALLVTKSGFRAVHESQAKVFVRTVNNFKTEFQRKVRTVVGGITALFYFRQILNPLKYGFYSIQLFSHKLLRWLDPVVLLAILTVSLILMREHSVYRIFVILYAFIIFVCLASALCIRNKKWFHLKLPFFIFLSHVAVLWAWLKFLSGHRMPIWKPSRS